MHSLHDTVKISDVDASDLFDVGILGFWFNERSGKLVLCDGATHTATALYNLKTSVRPEGSAGAPDLEEDDVILEAIGKGWVRLRYDYDSRHLFLHGSPRGCLKVAQEFAYSGHIKVEAVIFDHVGNARHRSGFLNGEGLDLYLERGNTLLASQVPSDHLWAGKNDDVVRHTNRFRP